MQIHLHTNDKRAVANNKKTPPQMKKFQLSVAMSLQLILLKGIDTTMIVCYPSARQRKLLNFQLRESIIQPCDFPLGCSTTDLQRTRRRAKPLKGTTYV